MNVSLFVCVALVSALVVNGEITGSDSLMQCSKFHFEEKVLEKLVLLEFKMKNHEKMIETWTSDLKMGLEIIEELKESTEHFVNVQNSDMEITKKNLLQRVEKETENLTNKIADRMVSFEKVIKEKMVAIDDAKTDNNRQIDVMRQELKSTTDTMYQNISDVMVKQTQRMEDIKVIQQRPSVAFSAYLTKTSSRGTDIVKFNNIWSNIGSAYDVNTGIFTAPKDGLYSFTAVLLSEHNKILYRNIWRNTEYLAATWNDDRGYKSSTLSVVLNLNKDDEVYIKSRSSSYGGVYSESVNIYSTFSGFLIT